jgi:hypothetical protein
MRDARTQFWFSFSPATRIAVHRRRALLVATLDTCGPALYVLAMVRRLARPLRLVSFLAIPLVLAGIASACGSRAAAGKCEPVEGIALVFDAERSPGDAEPARAGIEAISGCQLVISDTHVVVFIAGQDVQRLLDAKEKVSAQIRPFDLSLATEDSGTIDRDCTVQLKHGGDPIRRSKPDR